MATKPMETLTLNGESFEVVDAEARSSLDELAPEVQAAEINIGDLTNLSTDIKTSLVAAINEVSTTRVPTSTTINGKTLSSNISLSAADINAVAKTGDTMTGVLTVTNNAVINAKDTNITIGSAPTADHYGGGFRVIDSNNAVIGGFYPTYFSNGRLGCTLQAMRTVNGTNNYNYLRLLIDDNGAQSVSVSNSEMWRTALGAAASSHNHAASNITSGTLSIARGGTGGGTVAAALGNLFVATANTSNLNSITTPGLYYISGTPANIPEGTNGLLIVVKLTSSYIKQIFQRMGTPGSNDGNIHIRTTSDGGSTWGSWATHDSAYRAGDTFSTTAAIFSGIVTSSTKNLMFTIPVGKSMANISSVTVTTFTGGARGISGYVNGSSDSYNWLGQGFTVTATKKSDKIVLITIASSTAFTNVSNNTPVNILAAVGLKFT